MGLGINRMLRLKLALVQRLALVKLREQ